MVIDGVVRICLREEDFRMAFGDMFRLLFTLTLLITEVFFYSVVGFQPTVLFLMVPTVLVVLCGSASLLIRAAFHFAVGPEGLDCFSVSSSEHMDWSGVASIRRVSFLGLDWLVLRGQGQARTIWLPLFVGRYSVLRDLLVTFGDPRCRWDEQLPLAA